MSHSYSRIVATAPEGGLARVLPAALAMAILMGFSMPVPERQAPAQQEVIFELASPMPEAAPPVAAAARPAPRKSLVPRPQEAPAASIAPQPTAAEVPMPEATDDVVTEETTQDEAITGEATTAPEGEVAQGGVVGAALGGSGDGNGNGNGAGGEGTSGTLAITPPRPRSWSWNCDWPFFPSSNDATVVVRVTVDEEGDAIRVEVTSATHQDFVPVAHECAKRSHYHPARLKDGTITTGISEPLPIHFIRY
jgi:hypothetical protein